MYGISKSEYQKYGCPECGCGIFNNNKGFKTDDVTPAQCNDCQYEFLIFRNGLNISTVGFLIGKNFEGKITYNYPALKSHPRKEIKKLVLLNRQE